MVHKVDKLEIIDSLSIRSYHYKEREQYMKLSKLGEFEGTMDVADINVDDTES